MYIPSDKYLETLNSYSRQPKSKIIIDNVEYTGMDIIKDHPSISQEAVKMIGEFPTKQCKLTIFNRNNDIEVVNKEIEVYRGLVLKDGSIEYIPQGVFIPKADGVKTNSTAKTIEIEMKDRSVEFDCPYGGIENIQYPCTYQQFISEICNRHNITLETLEFPFFDSILEERPNFDMNTTTERNLIAKIADLSGCIAQMSRNGGLIISKPNKTNVVVRKTDYKSLPSKEKTFGEINSVALGNSNITNNVVEKDAESISINGLFEWKVYDNPYSDKHKEEMIKSIFNEIKGMKIVPFQLKDVIDSYLFDINDIITIEDKQGNLFETTILKINTTSRIFTDLEASVQDNSSVEHKIAGSSKATLANLKAEVDYVNEQIILKLDKKNFNCAEILLRINEDETETVIKADKISLDGKKIDMTVGNITITSDNFEVDSEGNMTCKNATITGGNLTLEDDGTQDGASIKIKVPTEYISDISLNDDLSGKKITAYFDVLNYEYLNGITEEYFNETGNQYINLYESSNGYSIRVQTIEDKGGDKIAMITLEQDGAVIEEIYSVYEDETVMTELQPITLPDDFGTITAINKQEVAELIVLLNTNERETSYSGSGITSDIICEYNYSQEDLDLIQNKIANRIEFTKKEIQKYDLNKDGKVTSFDLLKVSKYVTANITPTKPGKLVIDTHAIEKNIQILDGDGNEKITIGLEGIHINGESILPSTKILWEATNVEGGYYMNGSQTINLSEKITKQKNGIILVWYGFDSSTAKRINGITSYQFVPKWQIESNNKSFVIQHMAFDKFAKIGTKNISISDDSIVGNNSNTAKGTSNGITYDNSTFILSYVLGV